MPSSCQNANSPFSSSFFHWVSLAAQIKDFSSAFEPFSFPFFFLQLLATIVLLSLLGALQTRQSIPQELHCHAPQVRTTESRRHRLATEEAETNAVHFSHRCTMSFVVLRHRHPNCVFHQRDPTKEPQPTPRFSGCLLSRKRTIASSLRSNGDSDGGRMRHRGCNSFFLDRR